MLLYLGILLVKTLHKVGILLVKTLHEVGILLVKTLSYLIVSRMIRPRPKSTLGIYDDFHKRNKSE